MKKDTKKAPVKGPEKKPDEKVKVNFEEIIFTNLANFKLNQDCSGYAYTKLDLCVTSFIEELFRIRT